jgi:catalase
MSGDPTAPIEAARLPLGMVGTLARLALIGVVLAAIVALLAYLGGWVTPNRLTPPRFVDRRF